MVRGVGLASQRGAQMSQSEVANLPRIGLCMGNGSVLPQWWDSGDFDWVRHRMSSCPLPYSEALHVVCGVWPNANTLSDYPDRLQRAKAWITVGNGSRSGRVGPWCWPVALCCGGGLTISEDDAKDGLN